MVKDCNKHLIPSPCVTCVIPAVKYGSTREFPLKCKQLMISLLKNNGDTLDRLSVHRNIESAVLDIPYFDPSINIVVDLQHGWNGGVGAETLKW